MNQAMDRPDTVRTTARAGLQTILDRLEITPLSPEAVARYKTKVQRDAIRQASILVRLFQNHPHVLERAALRLKTASDFMGHAMGLTLVATVVAAIIAPFFAVPWSITCRLLAATWMSTCFAGVSGLLVLESCETTCQTRASEIRNLAWSTVELRQVLDVPYTAWNLVGRAAAPGVDFAVHQLGTDPFLQIIYTDGQRVQSAFIYGWAGDKELIEFNGEIVAVDIPTWPS